MKTKSKTMSTTKVRPKRSVWIFILPVFGLVGLFFTAQQLLPHVSASYWKRQLADASDDRVEIILDQIAGLGNVSIPLLVESLASERETVAWAAKRRLLDQLEQWKSLPEEEYSSQTLLLADTLASQAATFGSAARNDASELAKQILLSASSGASSNNRSRLIAACGEVLQTTSSLQGESSIPPTQVRAISAQQAEEERDRIRAVALERWNSEKSAAMQFDPLPGGGLPIGETPTETRKTDNLLPGEDREVPPAFFQEPAGTRSLDFSNRMENPLKVPETASPHNARNNPPLKEEGQIKSMSHEEPEGGEDSSVVTLKTWKTMDLMRQLCKADENQAKRFQAELSRRGLSAAEIEVAGRLFDPDPAERKRLVAELPGMADIDASAWLMQCCKDVDADVRLASFSLLATSTNTILLQKLKVMAQNDPDARIQHIADQMRDERNR